MTTSKPILVESDSRDIINPDRYENLFNQYINDGEVPYKFYNLLSKFTITDISLEFVEKFKIESEIPWTTISHNIYGTQHLWWLICILNGVRNPTKLLEAGSVIYVITKEFLPEVFTALREKI